MWGGGGGECSFLILRHMVNIKLFSFEGLEMFEDKTKCLENIENRVEN
jgi:hypothetical protein